MWRTVLAVLVMVGGSGLGATGSAAAQGAPPTPVAEAVPRFEPGRCPFRLPDDLVEGETIRCGYVAAPLRHDDPGGPTIRLAVAILTSRADEPAAEPLIVLNGGPGQEVNAILPAFSATSPINLLTLLERQDVVLFDQRGVGFSRPSLACPFDAVAGRRPAEPLPFDVATEVMAEVVAECLEGHAERGVDLDAFDTTENAADVEAIRVALGYERVDLFGISYGTRLAFSVMRDFPTSVRAAVLASVFPPQADLLSGQVIAFDRALKRLFAACAADADCAAASPDLEADFLAAVEALDADPVELSTLNPLTAEMVEVTVDGLAFMSVVYIGLFVGPLLESMPTLISEAAEGNLDPLSSVLPVLTLLNEGISTGMLYTFNCQDEFGFTTPEEARRRVEEAGVLPPLADPEVVGADIYVEVCSDLGLTRSAAIENEPVRSDTPTLLVSGEYDPITPPAYAELAAETLPNAAVVEVPGVGHDPITTGGLCPTLIVAEFLANPAGEPDTGCLGQMGVDLAP